MPAHDGAAEGAGRSETCGASASPAAFLRTGVSRCDGAGVGAMAAATDPKMKSWGRNTQLRKELIRHRRVVMLAGVQDVFADGDASGSSLGDRTADHRCFDELRTSAHNGKDLHAKSLS